MKEPRQVKFLAGHNGELVPVTELHIPYEHPLYQFTGFYTKSGEEIYEGHVVRNTFSYDAEEPDILVGEVKWNNDEGRWEVFDDVFGEESYGSDVFPCDEILEHVYTRDKKRDDELLEIFSRYLLMPKATTMAPSSSDIYNDGWVVVTGRAIIAPNPHRHYTLEEFKDKYHESSDFRKFCVSLKLPN